MLAAPRAGVAAADLSCAMKRDGTRAAPNIVFLLADDLGWNDVSFHGSPQIPTPNIDDLARTGVQLDQYYVNAVCSPSRASLMSGRSIIHHGVYSPYGFGSVSEGLNLSYTTLPQHLKNEYGYHTYMIGKWHLGMKTTQYQPTARGFDRYLGYYSGYSDYWTHRSDANGKDLHTGTRSTRPESIVPDFDKLDGTYSTTLYAETAEQWIAEHSRRHRCEPMFLYVAFQTMHSANQVYLQAPDEYLGRFSSIDPAACGQYDASCSQASKRRSVAAMVSAMDDAVGRIVGALDRSGLRGNTVVVFSTDNGGPVNTNGNMASNFPLRGGKAGFWEGGVRGVGLVNGPGTGRPRVSRELFHISDWMPSLLTAIKRATTGDARARHAVRLGPSEVPFKLGDGVDNWDAVNPRPGAAPARTEILHTLVPQGASSRQVALRSGRYKLVVWPDTQQPGWAPPPGLAWDYANFTVKCPEPPAQAQAEAALCATPCLFDVEADPCEHSDLAAAMPGRVAGMLARVAEYARTAVQPWTMFAAQDPRAQPALHGGELAPWMAPEEDAGYYPTKYAGPGYPPAD
eukprot:m51a1_g9326 hypothetical protein (570) ;mRNA; f:2667-4570